MQWYETESGWARFEMEKSIVLNEFRNFHFDLDEEAHVTCEGWVGPNNTLNRAHFVRLILPHNYGFGEPPRVKLPLECLPSDAPHVFKDGSICIEHNDWTPHHDLLEAIYWTIGWLSLYEHFLRTGERWD